MRFVAWATSAKPGARSGYYRGYLHRDRVHHQMSIQHSNGYTPDSLRCAGKAWEMYELGVVTLVQKRMGSEDYIYIAVKK